MTFQKTRAIPSSVSLPPVCASRCEPSALSSQLQPPHLPAATFPYMIATGPYTCGAGSPKEALHVVSGLVHDALSQHRKVTNRADFLSNSWRERGQQDRTSSAVTSPNPQIAIAWAPDSGQPWGADPCRPLEGAAAFGAQLSSADGNSWEGPGEPELLSVDEGMDAALQKGCGRGW